MALNKEALCEELPKEIKFYEILDSRSNLSFLEVANIDGQLPFHNIRVILIHTSKL